MKKIVRRYRISKFKCFMNGLTFALLSVAALTLCLTNMNNLQDTKAAVILPFFIAVLSIVLGFVTMLRTGLQQ